MLNAKKIYRFCLVVSVSVFFNTVNAQSWQESDIIITEKDYFGASSSFSSDGSTLAVSYAYTNKAVVFHQLNGKWNKIGADIDYGSSVSLSSDGRIIAIGCAKCGTNKTGQVTIHKNINDVWTKIGSSILGAAEEDYFGKSIALSDDGTVIAVGSRQFDKEGYVKFFKNINDNWTQIGLTITGEEVGDGFGYSVSLSGDGSIAAIGAPLNDGNGENSGQVRIFKNINDNWTQIGLTIVGEAATDNSGASVSLSSDGNTLAIGAPGNDGNGENSGQIRIFEYLNDTWTQLGSDFDGSKAIAGKERGGLGIKLALSGDGETLVAIDEEYLGFPGTMNILTYKLKNGIWLQLRNIYEDDEIALGTGSSGLSSVSIDDKGEILAVGGPELQFNSALDSTDTEGDALMIYELKEVNKTINLAQITYSIYPNPTLDLIHLEVSPEHIGDSYEIHNQLGSQLLKGEILGINTDLDFTNFSEGYYLISVGQKIKQTFKVLKK